MEAAKVFGLKFLTPATSEYRVQLKAAWIKFLVNSVNVKAKIILDKGIKSLNFNAQHAH